MKSTEKDSIPDQNEYIHLMVSDSEFLRRCLFKLSEKLFTSKFRRYLVRALYEYYREYEEAPGLSNFDLFIEFSIKKGLINRKNKELYEKYKETIKNKKIPNRKIYIDKLSDFITIMCGKKAGEEIEEELKRDDPRKEKIIEIFNNNLNMSLGFNDLKYESILDISKDDIDLQQPVTKFNIPVLDSALGGGIKRGTLTVLFGFTGSGKTYLCIHLGKLAARFGNTVLHSHTEMSTKQIRARYIRSITGMTKEEYQSKVGSSLKLVRKAMMKNSMIFISPAEENSYSITSLIDSVEEYNKTNKKKISLLLIDSPDEFTPPPGKYKDNIAANTAIYSYLIRKSIELDIAIVVTTQSNRAGENTYWLTHSHIGWNIGKSQKASCVISLNVSQQEILKGYCRYLLIKSRDEKTGTKCWSKRNLERAQCVLESGKYVKQDYDERLEDAKEL